jgi:hypothetical protein
VFYVHSVYVYVSNHGIVKCLFLRPYRYTARPKLTHVVFIFSVGMWKIARLSDSAARIAHRPSASRIGRGARGPTSGLRRALDKRADRPARENKNKKRTAQMCGSTYFLKVQLV